MKKIKRVSANEKVQAVFGETAVMAILERMEDGIKLVAEGQTGLQRQLDELTDEVHSFRDETNIRFAQIDARFAQIDARFEKMEARFEQVEANQKVTLEHLLLIDERLEAIEIELKEIDVELARLSKERLSKEESGGLSKRVVVLEKDMEKYRIFFRAKAGLKSA